MIAGYDPHRIADLAHRTCCALGDLAGIGCSDPAADHAVAAIGRLRRVLEADLLPAVRAIQAADPLARGVLRSEPSSGGLRDWLAAIVGARYREMTDAELFAELERLELDLPYDEDFQTDMSDPFWIRFEPLAIELAARASRDEDVADLVVRTAGRSPLISMAVRFAAFDPRLVGRMLGEVARTPSAMVDLRSNYQARGAEALLSVLIRSPGVALDVLDASVLKELIEWPTIDRGHVGAFLEAAMGVPFRDRSRLDDAYGVLQDLVALANRPRHERGFPPDISPTLTRIVVQYVPFFMTSLDGHSSVYLKDFALRDIGIQLGGYPEVLDLFGALLRDPASRDIVFASIPPLAVLGAGDNGPLGIGPDDVADYVDTIGKAAENEQIEEQLTTERDRRNALLAIDVAFEALTIATSVLGPLVVGGVEVPLVLLERGTTTVVEWTMEETDLGIGAVRNVAFLLVVFGLGVGVLRSRAGERRDDPETVELAHDILDRIETRLAEGAEIDDIGGLIDDFGRTVRLLDEDGVMDVVDDPRVRPPDIDVDGSADVE